MNCSKRNRRVQNGRIGATGLENQSLPEVRIQETLDLRGRLGMEEMETASLLFIAIDGEVDNAYRFCEAIMTLWYEPVLFVAWRIVTIALSSSVGTSMAKRLCFIAFNTTDPRAG
jgi:hypothetical protein